MPPKMWDSAGPAVGRHTAGRLAGARCRRRRLAGCVPLLPPMGQAKGPATTAATNPQLALTAAGQVA